VTKVTGFLFVWRLFSQSTRLDLLLFLMHELAYFTMPCTKQGIYRLIAIVRALIFKINLN